MLRFDFAQRHHRPLATWALVGVMAVLFLGELAWGRGAWVSVVYAMGGSLGLAIQQGQWWRLVSAGFLHYGPIHIGANAMALLSLGRLLELLLGRRRLLIAFVLAVIGGNALAAFSHPLIHEAGASSGIWGLFTLTAALVLLPNELVPDEVRSLMRPRVMQALVLNLGISFLPGISLLAHLGGGIVGAVLGVWPAFRRGRSSVADPAAPPSRDPAWAVVGAWLTVALVVGSLGAALSTGHAWEVDFQLQQTDQR